jgi:hypothetical protein
MDGTNKYSRSHSRSSVAVHNVVLPNGKGHVVVNKCCNKQVKPRFTQLVSVFMVKGVGYSTVLMVAQMMWGW